MRYKQFKKLHRHRFAKERCGICKKIYLNHHTNLVTNGIYTTCQHEPSIDIGRVRWLYMPPVTGDPIAHSVQLKYKYSEVQTIMNDEWLIDLRNQQGR